MIDFNNLTYYYKPNQLVLDGVSLELADGKLVGLLGKNGTGKTTLMHLMAGLLEPRIGKVTVNGFIPFDRNPNYLGDIYFLPDTFYIEDITIKNYLKAYAQFYPRFDLSKFERLTEVYKLDKSHKISDLSLGQAKQVVMSFALSTNASILLFDEPTNGLDIIAKDAFKRLIVSETSEEQTVIISTHQAKDIELLIDHIIILNEQKIALNRSVSDILDHYNFEHLSDKRNKKIVFSKSYLGEHKAITYKEGFDTSLDLELLFHAVCEGIQL